MRSVASNNGKSSFSICTASLLTREKIVPLFCNLLQDYRTLKKKIRKIIQVLFCNLSNSKVLTGFMATFTAASSLLRNKILSIDAK